MGSDILCYKVEYLIKMHINYIALYYSTLDFIILHYGDISII